MVDDERSEIVKSWRSDSASGAGYAETCKHSSSRVPNGRPNAPDSGLMLFIVDRITGLADLCQFLQQSSSLCSGCGCESGRPSEMTLSITGAGWNAKAAFPEAEQ